ncbi:hypothetical protein FVEG_09916 [Fusarium verticillioides 7600]|uniref:Azaphilone pigments biosynthesis cluster protein L N-terminal domain-containing protein n=1 Tax=Gibberella moniliformis (strain M3125 / FGSC 7600) TaxID=334819 RepID=W7MIM3_GIBM7|nr:hypothetical protein FVEG_09916 [Fusarium verticillioides 7600]EWG50786.1 hypothetical protein FVEG_09916 [Fusarium verticillioides 7600]
MDPLSLAASIAGLVSLGDIVFKYALRYCKSVKDAPKEVNDLLNEIKDLTLLLHNLSMVAYGHGLQTQTNPQNPATAHKPHHLHECQQLLNQLEDGLSKFEQKSGLDKVQSRLKWPFTTSVTKEMLQAIGRHKQTINIALGADSLTKLQICLSRQDETLKEIQELKVEQVGHIDKSPFVHASCSGNETILNLLKDHLGDPSADGLIMNHKAERHMEFDLMLAIRHGNVDACQKLLDLGCPIDIEITPGKASGLEQSATPLMFAICERASIAVVKWLLDNNAHVSAVSWNKLKRFYCNGLSAALRDSTFNPLIPVLVTKYLEERGKFLARHGNYLSIALASRNTQGLAILLDEFSKNHKDIDIYTMLNPTLDEMDPQGPLHIAAGLNDLAAFKALVVAGADIEQLDYNGSSPLHIAAAANALSVAEYLICSGARLNPISYYSSTPILNACLTASSQVIQLLIKSGANYQAVNDLGSNCLTLFVLTRPIRRDPLNINAFKALLDAGIDLFARNKFGLDAARSILISDTPIYLYYILNHFPRFFNNRSLSWAAIELLGGASTHSLCALFLSRKLRLIRPLLTIKEFLDLSDLSNPGRHTFFCSSVISGSVEAVRNFLKYGANIQHACPDHGTPLIAALTYRRFDIVKILLLSDAKAFTTSFLATEVHFMECDEKIKRWLLVERHYEQPKLEEMSWNTNHVPTKGAGVVIGEVEIEWHWRKKHGESILAYATRRQRLVRELRGTQVNLVRII